MTGRRFGILVAVISLLHAFLWAYLIPPGQGPDEEAHVGAVEHIFFTGRLPIIYKDFHLTVNWREALETTGFSRVRLQQYLRPTYAEFLPTRSSREFTGGGSYHSGSPGGPPLHYFLLLPFYAAANVAPFLERLYYLRLAGVLFAAGTAFYSWRILRALGGDTSVTRAAAMVIALQPTIHFLSGYVTTDNGALFATTLLMAAHFSIPREKVAARALFLGVLAGIAFLMKPFAASAAVSAALLPVFFARTGERKQALLAAAGMTAVAVFVALPWFLWSHRIYGGLTGHAVHEADAGLRLLDALRSYLAIASPSALLSQAIGVFGWLDTPLPRGLRMAEGVLFGMGWLLFIVLLLRKKISGLWAQLAGFALIHTLFVAAIALRLMMTTGYRLGVQARYFILPIAAWTAPAICGWLNSLPEARRAQLARAVVLLALLNALFALGWTVVPRYFL